jgi:hypothetical protein
MQNKISILIFILSLLLTTQKVEAQQLKHFSRDSIEFLKQVTTLMDSPNHKKESKAFNEEFEPFWLSEKITPEKRQNIFDISDALLNKKARAYPDYHTYFTSLMLFLSKDLAPSDYDNWEKGLFLLLSNKKTKLKTIKEYLLQTQQLLKDNTIFQSYSTRWVSTSNNYHYEFTDKVAIVFEETNLKCFAQRDSSTIYATKGIYYPIEKQWKGETGKITWERAGFPADEVFAQISNYRINMKKSNFHVDTATYTNTNYFKEPLMGSLEEKVMRVSNPSRAIYPRFESFHKRIEIRNLYPNVDYNGGVAIQGAKFIGKGSQEELASLSISRNDSLFMTAKSKHFTIRKDRVTGINTEINLLLDTLNIYHPGLLFKYLVDKKEVDLIRDGQGLSQSPFFNNYHNVIMDFELLSWKMGENTIDFRMIKGATSKQANFESSNYFSANRYARLQGMDKLHPLVGLRKFAEYNYGSTFTAGDYANFIQKSATQVRQQLMSLSFLGFVSYDIESDEVTILERLYDYIRAGIGKQDYDVISFTSATESSRPNALLNLENYNLKIYGVQQIAVSDSQNVVIFPRNEEIILKQNRDFMFDGHVRAGLFDLHGNDFFFSYDDFKVDLSNIDSLLISVRYDDVDYYGKRRAVQIDNVIQMITGDLLIDAPDNKSGLKDLPQYPIFNSTDASFVYYDRPSIQKGVYKRDNFYFRMDPYSMENINDLGRKDVKFAGTFVSDSIFPTFRENLSLQEDLSLGFITQTPTEGYKAYGKGNYQNTIRLSNQGLRGDGVLNYLASTTSSKDFVFLPEKMYAQAESFQLKGQDTPVSYPMVNGQELYAEWLPLKDKYTVQSKESPLTMFTGNVIMNGALTLQPDGLTGAGAMSFENAGLQSDYFTYSNRTIDADTSNFKLKGQDEEFIAFETEGVKSHIDFTNRKGEFIANQQNSFANFPDNQYICYMRNFDWLMDKQQIDFGIKNQEILAKAWKENTLESLPASADNRFVSTHYKQDSLHFMAPYASYDITSQTIHAQYVKQIQVADATIYPNEGDVTVERNALMQTLRQAKVIADTTNNYHTLYDAIVNIHGRKSFSGSANYDYVDRNKRVQLIRFDVVDVDSTGQTYATGVLEEETSFTLSPDFDFKGRVKMNAREPFLVFDGSTHIHNGQSKLGTNWLRFTSEINPNDIMIPVTDHPLNDDQQEVYNSFFLTNDSTRIYSSFLSKRDFYTDNVLMSAEGYLTYDNHNKSYMIGSKEKLRNHDLPGRMLCFDNEGKGLNAEGPINLGTDMGQVRHVSFGRIEHDLKENEITMDLMLGLDFWIAEPAMKIFEETFKNENLPGGNLATKSFSKNLAQILGQEEAQKAIMQMNANGTFKNLPEKLIHSIFFNHLDFHWNRKDRAYESVGDLVVGNINKTQLNKKVKGKVEIQKRRSGNRISMYFELSKSTWFFFEYHHGVMFVLSSEDKFNQVIEGMKPEKRTMKKEDRIGDEPYSFILAPRSKKTKFKKRFNL